MTKHILSCLVLGSAVCLTQAFAAQAVKAPATVTREQATQTALARAPGATVRTAELEREHGRLIWSFDLSHPGRSGVTEIQVDAKTGKVVSRKKESASQESAEATREAAEK